MVCVRTRKETNNPTPRGVSRRACVSALVLGLALVGCSSDDPTSDSDTPAASDDTDGQTTETGPEGDTDTDAAGDTDALHPVDAATRANLEIAVAHFHDPYSGDEVLELFPDACGPYMAVTGVCLPVYIDEALDATCDPSDQVCNAADLNHGNGKLGFPTAIVPFRYLYSPTADHTFVVCAEHRTVAICGGRLDHLMTDAEIPSPWTLASRGCTVTPVYLGSDPRLVTPVQ